MEDSHLCLHQEDTIVGAIIKLFEEALDFRVSLKHGGKRGTTKEQHTAPWWYEEYTKFIHVVHQITRTHERATMMLNSFICSITIHSEEFQWIHHEDGGGGGGGGGEVCSS
jgi:hypothetical protein